MHTADFVDFVDIAGSVDFVDFADNSIDLVLLDRFVGFADCNSCQLVDVRNSCCFLCQLLLREHSVADPQRDPLRDHHLEVLD